MRRRTFLKRGLFGAAILGLAGGSTLALVPGRAAAVATRPLRVLDERGFHVMVAIARRIVTDPGTDAVAIAHGVDDLLTHLPVEVRKDLTKLLVVFENALIGLVFDGRPWPFTRLATSAQDEVLRRWRASRLALRRSGYQCLRKLCYLAHYARPLSWQPIDFPTPAKVGEPYDDSKMGTPEWLKEHDLEVIP